MAELTESQRHELATFLRSSRARLVPERPPAEGQRRRRIRGGRREEIAERAGISVTWYTWLEQARKVSVSSTTLARISRALELSAAERAYLFEIAALRDPETTDASAGNESAVSLQRIIDAIAVPAYALDRTWNVIAMNDGAARLFVGWTKAEPINLLHYVVLDATARTLISDWSNRALRVIAEFRADSSRHVGEEHLRHFVDDLAEKSAFFRSAWDEHEVLNREGGRRCFDHPIDGRLEYEQVTFTSTLSRDTKLVMLVPSR
jgi:transcriptional regulator with XRE-family HTH domain